MEFAEPYLDEILPRGSAFEKHGRWWRGTVAAIIFLSGPHMDAPPSLAEEPVVRVFNNENRNLLVGNFSHNENARAIIQHLQSQNLPADALQPIGSTLKFLSVPVPAGDYYYSPRPKLGRIPISIKYIFYIHNIIAKAGNLILCFRKRFRALVCNECRRQN